MKKLLSIDALWVVVPIIILGYLGFQNTLVAIGIILYALLWVLAMLCLGYCLVLFGNAIAKLLNL